MRELVVIIWSVLLMALGFLLMYSAKKQRRKLGKYAMIYKLILALSTFLISFIVYYFWIDSPHLIWVSRLSILLLGVLNVWVMYKRPWTVRHATKYEEDAFLPEFLFVLVGGLVLAIAFVAAPQTFGIIPYSVDVSRTLWEAPIIYLLPFLILKAIDFSGQVPFREIENPWVFTLEEANPQDWPWRDLLQVNFEVKRSLLDEYNLFSTPARPWIEGPKEVNVAQVFRLAMQERRKRSELSSIQDMGDEYDGTPRFCWIFYFKTIWYNPSTWFRKDRYINPDLSINQNKIQKGDIIVARRIPGDGTKAAGLDYNDMMAGGDDPEKTVVIRR